MQRHEIPTHLHVEDKVFWGLSVRQALTLAGGVSGGYSLWADAGLPDPLRGVLAAACVVLAAVLALVRPLGRGLEEWGFVLLHALTTPRVSTWRPAGSRAGGARPEPSSWVPLRPQVAWQRPAHGRPVARTQEGRR